MIARRLGHTLVAACLAGTLGGCANDGATGGTGGHGDAGAADGRDAGGSGGSGGAVGSGGSDGSGGDSGSGGAVGSGGNGGSGGAGGASDAGDDSGSDGADGASDSGDDSGADMSADSGDDAGGDTDGNVDPATVPICDVTITENSYTLTMSGCNGIASCRGVIRYRNDSSATLRFVVISFSVPDGVTCIKTHSTSKWVISDDGATSHRCFFTTNPATPWNVAASGGTFSFGYDLTAGFAATPPTDITIHEAGCAGSDGGTHFPDGGSDADAEPPGDSAVEASDGGVDAGEVSDGGVDAGEVSDGGAGADEVTDGG